MKGQSFLKYILHLKPIYHVIKTKVVVGLCGKVLIVGGAIGVASVRSCEKFPPCLIAPVPAGSKMDLPRLMPISDSGSASVKTY